jgi:hypothetical protein
MFGTEASPFIDFWKAFSHDEDLHGGIHGILVDAQFPVAPDVRHGPIPLFPSSSSPRPRVFYKKALRPLP